MRRFYSLFVLYFISTACVASWNEVEFTGYFSVGTGYQRALIGPLDQAVNHKLLLNLSADVSYRRFFIESDERRNVLRYGSGIIGYHLWQQDDASLALIGTGYHQAIGPDLITAFGKQHIAALEGLALRDSDFLVGLRYQRYWGQHYWAMEAGQDIDSHYGQQLRFLYSYRQMVRNWDLYYNAGLSFSTAKVVDYYYGVRPAESLLNRPVYQAGAGQQLHFGISALYPLSTDWLLELGLAANLFSRAYTASPLSSRDSEFLSLVKFRYVF
jgi:outer membrane scaffolding protein for murein synthesis (MipA/OmpV family)